MPLPAPRPPLSRAALERVLARAAELQGQTPTTDESLGALTDEQILELGKEVGLTPESLRQAIAEERGRVVVPEAKGAAGWFGPAAISSVRVVPGAAPAVLSSLDATMRSDLPFEVGRRFPERIQWIPSRNFFDAVRSTFAGTSQGLDLKLAEDVAASVVAVDDQRTHIRAEASLTETRRRALRRTILWPSLVAAMLALLSIAGKIPVPIAVGLVAATAGLVAMMQRSWYRRKALRVANALEQLLDRLEFGPPRKPKGIVEKLLG